MSPWLRSMPTVVKYFCAENPSNIIVVDRVVQRVKDPTKPTEIDRPKAKQVDLKPMVGWIRVFLSQKPNIQFG